MSDHSSTPALPTTDEPKTPLWFTLLGIFLFIAGTLTVLALNNDSESGAESQEASAQEPKIKVREVPSEAVHRPAPGHEGHNHP